MKNPTDAKTIYKIHATLAKTCKPELNAKQVMESWSDLQLYCFIVVDTYTFGRSWSDSIANAQCHMQDRTKAIKAFSMFDKEKL